MKDPDTLNSTVTENAYNTVQTVTEDTYRDQGPAKSFIINYKNLQEKINFNNKRQHGKIKRQDLMVKQDFKHLAKQTVMLVYYVIIPPIYREQIFVNY
jgi:hypothetical protein